MYYASEKYSLTFEYLNEIEEKFIQDITDYIKMKPFIWNEITNKILYNRYITYVKDTTFIITLYEIEDNNLKSLFELLKELLRKGYVTKIIYKDEFIIVHLYSILITKILSSHNNWLIAITYSILSKSNLKIDIYLNVYYESKTEKKYIDSVVFQNNIPKITFITNFNDQLISEDMIKVLLYIFKTKEYSDINPLFLQKIKFDYDLKKYRKKIIEEITCILEEK